MPFANAAVSAISKYFNRWDTNTFIIFTIYYTGNERAFPCKGNQSFHYNSFTNNKKTGTATKGLINVFILLLKVYTYEKGIYSTVYYALSEWQGCCATGQGRKALHPARRSYD
jgi:hypothetical protein